MKCHLSSDIRHWTKWYHCLKFYYSRLNWWGWCVDFFSLFAHSNEGNFQISNSFKKKTVKTIFIVMKCRTFCFSFHFHHFHIFRRTENLKTKCIQAKHIHFFFTLSTIWWIIPIKTLFAYKVEVLKWSTACLFAFSIFVLFFYSICRYFNQLITASFFLLLSILFVNIMSL